MLGGLKKSMKVDWNDWLFRFKNKLFYLRYSLFYSWFMPAGRVKLICPHCQRIQQRNECEEGFSSIGIKREIITKVIRCKKCNQVILTECIYRI